MWSDWIHSKCLQVNTPTVKGDGAGLSRISRAATDQQIPPALKWEALLFRSGYEQKHVFVVPCVLFASQFPQLWLRVLSSRSCKCNQSLTALYITMATPPSVSPDARLMRAVDSRTNWFIKDYGSSAQGLCIKEEDLGQNWFQMHAAAQTESLRQGGLMHE